jgi:hypothetical protein
MGWRRRTRFMRRVTIRLTLPGMALERVDERDDRSVVDLDENMFRQALNRERPSVVLRIGSHLRAEPAGNLERLGGRGIVELHREKIERARMLEPIEEGVEARTDAHMSAAVGDLAGADVEQRLGLHGRDLRALLDRTVRPAETLEDDVRSGAGLDPYEMDPVRGRGEIALDHVLEDESFLQDQTNERRRNQKAALCLHSETPTHYGRERRGKHRRLGVPA